jgi:hypothetical protein
MGIVIMSGHNYWECQKKGEGELMPSNSDHDLAARLGRLLAELEAAKRSRPRRGRGRPDTGIRSGYARVEAYIPVDIRDALDRLADRRETRTGKSTRRADVIRDALVRYLREHLPEAGI